MEIDNRMDAIQNQIVALSQKVDGLYQKIDQLSCQLSESVSEIRQTARANPENTPSATNLRTNVYKTQSLLDSVMEHKDILIEGNAENNNSVQNIDNALSADVQVQRLTAQLTAAYNRIAALEEQLLSRRIHS